MLGLLPAILAKGPTSAPAAGLPDASSSSPAMKLLNFDRRELLTLSMLGFEIQEDEPSLGDCDRRLLNSSKPPMKLAL